VKNRGDRRSVTVFVILSLALLTTTTGCTGTAKKLSDVESRRFVVLDNNNNVVAVLGQIESEDTVAVALTDGSGQRGREHMKALLYGDKTGSGVSLFANGHPRVVVFSEEETAGIYICDQSRNPRAALIRNDSLGLTSAVLLDANGNVAANLGAVWDDPSKGGTTAQAKIATDEILHKFKAAEDKRIMDALHSNWLEALPEIDKQLGKSKRGTPKN